MKFLRCILTSGVTLLLGLAASRAEAYSYCGYHDSTFRMTAYHWNSEFWVDMLVDQANKWNRVHPVLSINRIKSSTMPVTKDGKNVVGWLDEADLKKYYNLSWSGVVGWTISWKSGNCGKVNEADLFFNPSISLFTPQTQVPYQLGYQEIALHELGHVLTQDHEDRTLAVMTAGEAVSDVLYASDKVGWLRSADYKFNVTDRRDMGIFPLRNNGAPKIYSTLSPTTVARGNNVTIRDISIQNLSAGLVVTNPSFKFFLENTTTGSVTEIGWYSWNSFCAYCTWSGNLTYRVPNTTVPGTYRVVATYQNSSSEDSDSSNNRAVFGTIRVN